jgi:DNA repair exonuclease SbcCD nuclease subunit
VKLALVTDTHFGWKNDSILFQNYFTSFYTDVFFPELEKRGIQTVIHLGDLFERRKYINIHILQRTRLDFLERLEKGRYDFHVMVGNHDTFFRETNDVNSVTELLHRRYPNFHIYEQPEVVVFDKLSVLILPWLNDGNMENGQKQIAKSKAKVVMGHLELVGFKMDQTQISTHGLEGNLFSKYKAVFSGHFHTPSVQGNIRYLGAPYEMTFADAGGDRGFHIFDTDTLELEFIPNPKRMFHFFRYDDRDTSHHGEMLTADYSMFTNAFVRVNVTSKTNPHLFEQVMDRIHKVNPADVDTRELYSLDVDETVDDQFGNPETGDVILTDTMTILDSYVDSIGMEIDHTRLKHILRDIYKEASNGAKE